MDRNTTTMEYPGFEVDDIAMHNKFPTLPLGRIEDPAALMSADDFQRYSCIVWRW
jgi:hypothetical protein